MKISQPYLCLNQCFRTLHRVFKSVCMVFLKEFNCFKHLKLISTKDLRIREVCDRCISSVVTSSSGPKTDKEESENWGHIVQCLWSECVNRVNSNLLMDNSDDRLYRLSNGKERQSPTSRLPSTSSATISSLKTGFPVVNNRPPKQVCRCRSFTKPFSPNDYWFGSLLRQSVTPKRLLIHLKRVCYLKWKRCVQEL